jgi:hypothetical protein
MGWWEAVGAILGQAGNVAMGGGEAALPADAEEQRERWRQQAMLELMRPSWDMPGDPALEQEGLNALGRPEGADAAADPAFVEYQNAALDQLRGLSRGGATQADSERLAASSAATGQYTRGAREAALAQMQSQGLGGANTDLAAMMAGSQGAIGAQSQREADMQELIAARQDAAMRSLGALGTSARGQAFDEASQRASAADAWNRDNVLSARGVRQRNVDRRNQATGTAFGNRFTQTTALLDAEQRGRADARAAQRSREDAAAQRTAGAVQAGYGVARAATSGYDDDEEDDD